MVAVFFVFSLSLLMLGFEEIKIMKICAGMMRHFM
jgi:hypothetical protein